MLEDVIVFLAKVLWDVVWYYIRRFLDRKLD